MESEEREFGFSDLTFRAAVLDALTANIAVLDPNGIIVAVNARWQAFAKANQLSDEAMSVGANYLEICRMARADPNARAAAEGIRDVMKGFRSNFYHEYPCHSPDEKRWFALRASPLVDYPHFVVVSHENITERILAESAIPSATDD